MEAASVSQPSHGGHGSHAGVLDEHHHGPPEANRSSRVEPQLLGMLLFIISEVMVFGAFFTAYFFIRVVGGAEWPAEGTELPKLIAGINTAILLSSSFTMHWTLESAKAENRFGMQAGILTTFLLGATFLFVQINEYVHIGFAPQDSAQGSIFYGLTGLHGAHVAVGLTLLAFTTIRTFRGHFTAEEHRGVEVPGIYWHFVDVMWIVVYTTVYIV
jgi:cytochrome c oxidase subunit III